MFCWRIWQKMGRYIYGIHICHQGVLGSVQNEQSLAIASLGFAKQIFACWCRDLSFQRGAAGCGTRLCRWARRGRHRSIRPVLKHRVLLPLLSRCLTLLTLLTFAPLLLLLPLLPGFYLFELLLHHLWYLTSPASPAPRDCEGDPLSTGSPPRDPPCTAQVIIHYFAIHQNHLKALWSDHPRDKDRPVLRVSLECARGRGIWERKSKFKSNLLQCFHFQNNCGKTKHLVWFKSWIDSKFWTLSPLHCTWPDSRHQNWPSIGMFLLGARRAYFRSKISSGNFRDAQVYKLGTAFLHDKKFISCWIVDVIPFCWTDINGTDLFW